MTKAQGMTLLTGEKTQGDFGFLISDCGYQGFTSAIRNPQSAIAMTLVELLVVLGIIGLILGMSVPALSTYTKQVRLKTAIRQVVGVVSLARSLAISSHEEHALVVDAEHQEIRIVNLVSGEPLEHVVRLPSSVSVAVQVGGQEAPEPKVVFRPTGSLAGRTTSIILTDHQRQHTITVSGVTGAVSVE